MREAPGAPMPEWPVGAVIAAAMREGLHVNSVFFESGRFLDVGTPAGITAAPASPASGTACRNNQAAEQTRRRRLRRSPNSATRIGDASWRPRKEQTVPGSNTDQRTAPDRPARMVRSPSGCCRAPTMRDGCRISSASWRTATARPVFEPHVTPACRGLPAGGRHRRRHRRHGIAMAAPRPELRAPPARPTPTTGACSSRSPATRRTGVHLAGLRRQLVQALRLPAGDDPRQPHSRGCVGEHGGTGTRTRRVTISVRT